MNKKFISGLLICTLCLSFCGCGDAKEGSTTDTVATVAQTESVQTEPAKTYTVHEIYDQIQAGVELVSPMEMEEEYITNYYDFDMSAMEDYVFSISEAAISAETVIIVKLADASKADEITSKINYVVEEKKSEMENYLPDQYDIVCKSKVQQKGNFVWLVISEKDEEINKIIESCI